MTQVIPRPYYVQKLLTWQGNGLIKVIMGPRRCGKSFLMKLFQAELLKQGLKSEQILSVDLDKKENVELCNPDRLHDVVMNWYRSDRANFLFIDEIQDCVGFEKVLASLCSRENLDIYVTGSNAHMLSGELATYLTGRYFPLEMMPLSFKEYRSAVITEGESAVDDFWQYIRFGSFPALVPYRHNESYCELYYQVLLSDVMLKDILPRYGVREPKTLQSIITTLVSSVGSSISSNKIANTLKSAGQSVSQPSVQRYLKALQDSYLFICAQRFDVRGRQALSGQEKYYMCDTGFRRHLIASTAEDRGHLIENVVYLELRRRYSSVFVGKNDDSEIDFVARKGTELAYYQVALSVLDEAVLHRELKAFDGKKDAYPCYLLTLDEFGKNDNHGGVRQLNIIDWLLEDSTM